MKKFGARSSFPSKRDETATLIFSKIENFAIHVSPTPVASDAMLIVNNKEIDSMSAQIWYHLLKTICHLKKEKTFMGHLPPTVPQDIDAMYGFVVLGCLQFYEVWKETVQDEQRSVIFDCSSEKQQRQVAFTQGLKLRQ